jgi:hypothetical protein
MKNKIILSLILVLSSQYVYSDDNILSMYSSLVKQWKEDIANAFDMAEKEVYNVVPSPNNEPVPDPDPKKCACKGTGKIVQGDGHVTPCPYHSSSAAPSATVEVKNITNFTCKCETRCACKTCQCKKVEKK